MSILRYGDVFREPKWRRNRIGCTRGAPPVMATKGPFRIHRSSWDRQGLAYSQGYGTVWDGIRAMIILFPSLVVPLQARAAELLHRPGLAWSPLDHGDASAPDGSMSGRRDPQYDSGRWLSHGVVGRLNSAAPSFVAIRTLPKGQAPTPIFTNASGRAAAGRR
jgi:hypothetical protein